MRALFLLAAIPAILGGCTPLPSKGEIEKSLTHDWAGQSSDTFFERYGAPIGEFTLSDGRKLYTWDNPKTTSIGGGSSVQAWSGPLGEANVTVITEEARTSVDRCKLQLTVSAAGKIENITGLAGNSYRCEQIFKFRARANG